MEKMNMLRGMQIEKAKALAEEKGGKCLSDEYLGKNGKLDWQCASGHFWSATYRHVVYRGTWCAICSKNKFQDGMLRVHGLAHERNGKCLSESYISTRDKLKWECSKGHQWKASYKTVKKSWCAVCAGNRLENPLKHSREIAEQRLGKCLSPSYINSRSPMEWLCQYGHTWMSPYSTVVTGRKWCPVCVRRNNISESRVRMILETYLGFGLPSCRPQWNRNPLTNFALELDGYNEKFKIAFEHDGEHHIGVSKSKKFGHQFEISYRKQIYRDYMKKENCRKNGVTLINIPIVPKDRRADFFYVLRNVINNCRPHGTHLDFTLAEIRDMKKKFFSF